MLRPRIVVCLDVDAGRVVKGTRFRDLRDVGDPVELAVRYEAEGADEIVFLDVSASKQERGTLPEVVRRTAEALFVPLTVGGGVRSADDIGPLLRAGADKISVNSAAVASPELLSAAAERFGRQCVVASVDAARAADGGWQCYTHGGSRPTGLDAVGWAAECARRGAGEILLTSIDRDGARSGYDLDLTRSVADAVAVPVVASGGAGAAEHLRDAIAVGRASAVLVAGILHDGLTTVRALKAALGGWGIPVRIPVTDQDRAVRQAADLDDVDFDRGDGLVPVVAQDAGTGRVLMLAYANRQALERTLATGEAHFWSRSRNTLWRKGETSGNTLAVGSLHADCDGDAVLALVTPAGPACHTGVESCFGAEAAPPPAAATSEPRAISVPSPASVLRRLDEVLAARASERPEGSYTVRLLDDPNLRTKKLGEEAAELVAALATRDLERVREEAADLLYHLLVALRAEGLGLDDVAGVLEARMKPRGSLSPGPPDRDEVDP